MFHTTDEDSSELSKLLEKICNYLASELHSIFPLVLLANALKPANLFQTMGMVSSKCLYTVRTCFHCPVFLDGVFEPVLSKQVEGKLLFNVCFPFCVVFPCLWDEFLHMKVNESELQ